MTRRFVLKASSTLAALLTTPLQIVSGRRAAAARTLLSAPLDIKGEWGDSSPAAATVVISRMREACLSGIRLFSDHQPARLRVDDHASGLPHIWLHEENPDTAWIVVDISARAWSQLAYQFGHELGHVMCNSWMWKVETHPPSRWLEEALVEAFSIRGLARLADGWEREPPFAGDAAYGRSLRAYRLHLIEKYRTGVGQKLVAGMAVWLRENREVLDRSHGLGQNEGPAIVAVLTELEADSGCVEDLGALNRWPERSAIPLEEYLRRWRSSCAQIGSPGRLPVRLQEIFALH